MSYNHITKDGVQALANELVINIAGSNIESIDLSSNELNDFAVPFLRLIIESCKQLKYLNIKEGLFISSRYEIARYKKVQSKCKILFWQLKNLY